MTLTCKLYALLMLLVFPAVMTAQEVTYTNYTALKDSMASRMIAYFNQHPERDMHRIGNNILKELDTPTLKKVTLPAPRKKELSGVQLYPLCKKSTFVICQVDYRRQTNDYWIDIFASAAALTKDGICVSNYHVFSDMIKAAPGYYQNRHFIRFAMDADGHIYPVTAILAADSVNDFSIFRIDTGNKELSPIPLGNPAPEGEEVYCLSHPKGNLYYLTKGLVARNVAAPGRNTPKVRLEMQITADYAVCSSGGPIVDTKGNLVGIVGSTNSLYADPQKIKNFQMTIKKAVPVKVIRECLR